jgi:archaellum component FlaC
MQIDEIIVKLSKEIEGQKQWLADLDKKAFIYNYNLAAKLGEECKKKYLSLFSNIQNLGKKLQSYNEYYTKIHDSLNQLYSKTNWKQEEYDQFLSDLATLEQSFKDMIKNDEPMNLFQEFSSDTIKSLFNEYTEDSSYYLILTELHEENFLKLYNLVVECIEALNAKSETLGSNLYS